MSDLFEGVYNGRTVFLTGHTGFVGSWMSIWLGVLGARVVGYSIDPPSDPNLFEVASLEDRVVHIHGDVRNLETLRDAMASCHPDLVFHLAAQSLVLPGYGDPVETYSTNVMGTVNFLEVVRTCPSIKACQVITTDKCYENRETGQAYRETDPLGGHDPYSSSKACAELVTSAYRSSFFADSLSIATVRAGNIVGGGDWGAERLIPDCIRALQKDETIFLRNPDAVRPWQFVLDPLAGYLHLGARMLNDPADFSGPWNFGPGGSGSLTVSQVVERLLEAWGSGTWEQQERTGQLHEAKRLNLDISKAAEKLNWRPVYSVQRAIDETVLWYRQHYREEGVDAYGSCLEQIESYVEEARLMGVPWAGK